MSSVRLFPVIKHAIEVERTGQLKLGSVNLAVTLSKLPDKSGYFRYFRLNDHPALVEEAARLIAARIEWLKSQNPELKPYFVTPEASTLALAHVLRQQYKINGTVLYKSTQSSSNKVLGVEYSSVTASKKKKLYLEKSSIAKMQDQDIILLDSVCTSGGTARATYELLMKAGIRPEQIKEAVMLFTEGQDRTEINIPTHNVKLNLHRFEHLPVLSVPNVKMNIGVVGSESAIKLSAIKDSLKQAVPDNNWEIIGVPAQSGKPEQPVEEETLEGAINRANDALARSPESDLVIAIESGIFKIPDNSAAGFSWYDKAVIYCLTNDGQSHLYFSDMVKFPTDCVEEAKRRGFDKCTVAMVMQEKGIVKNHKDPHASIAPYKPRAEYLKEAALRLCADLFVPVQPTPSIGNKL